MKTRRFTDAQMVAAVRSAEAGTQVAAICRTLGMSEATCFRWKRRIGDRGTAEVRELRRLREEN